MDVNFTKKNAYEMFNQIAKTYDRLNTLLSLGFHYYWRKAPLSWIEKEQNIQYLDLATGTGDQLIAVMDKMPKIEKAIGLDPAKNMLQIAKNKISNKPYKEKVQFVCGYADSIPYENDYFDLTTLTFGLRNFHQLEKGLQELYRVTKQTGQVHIIEFNTPKKILLPFYTFYLKIMVPIVGKLFSKHEFAYKYLQESIESFETSDQTLKKLIDCGFRSVFNEKIWFGLINHFIAIK